MEGSGRGTCESRAPMAAPSPPRTPLPGVEPAVRSCPPTRSAWGSPNHWATPARAHSTLDVVKERRGPALVPGTTCRRDPLQRRHPWPGPRSLSPHVRVQGGEGPAGGGPEPDSLEGSLQPAVLCSSGTFPGVGCPPKGRCGRRGPPSLHRTPAPITCTPSRAGAPSDVSRPVCSPSARSVGAGNLSCRPPRSRRLAQDERPLFAGQTHGEQPPARPLPARPGAQEPEGTYHLTAPAPGLPGNGRRGHAPRTWAPALPSGGAGGAPASAQGLGRRGARPRGPWIRPVRCLQLGPSWPRV